MSKDRIVSQSLNDPVGSIYDIDGQCYIKTSHGDSTPNHLILNEDGERCTDISQINKCETGSGQRKATLQTGGGYPCHGDITGLGRTEYTTMDYNPDTRAWHARYSDRIAKQSGAIARDMPEGFDIDAWHTRAKYIYDPCRYKDCQPPYRYRPYGGHRGWIVSRPKDPDYQYNSIRFCKVHRYGWFRILPKSTINGVDKIKFWAWAQFPFYNTGAVRWKVYLREKSTQKWLDSNVGWNKNRWYIEEAQRRGWPGTAQEWYTRTGYGAQRSKHNPYYYYNMQGHALSGKLPVYDYRKTPAKFHDMPIDGVEMRVWFGTQSNMQAHIQTLILEKNGVDIPYLDSSISLRSTPSSEHWF
jgi:hypothetical protein